MKTGLSSASISNRLSKIALGTVQFGQAYGISNQKGQPGDQEVRDILNLATRHGIDLLDTAPAYGESEDVLGRVLEHTDNFKIVTKTLALRSLDLSDSTYSSILKTFEHSLKRMKVEHTYGLIVHLAEDILGPSGDQVWKALEHLKADGSVRRIGVSCYTTDELKTIMGRYPINLVQIPFNVFDQNLLRDGLIEDLMKSDIEVHSRSTFLQGLALMDPDHLPDGFLRAEPAVRALHQLAKSGAVSPLELALGFVNATNGIDRMVIGVTTQEELQEVIDGLSRSLPAELDTGSLAVDDEVIISPAMWPPDSQESWSFDFSTTSGSETK